MTLLFSNQSRKEKCSFGIITISSVWEFHSICSSVLAAGACRYSCDRGADGMARYSESSGTSFDIELSINFYQESMNVVQTFI